MNLAVLSSRTEDQLILCCSHTHLTAAQQQHIQQLASQVIDWEYVLHAARIQGVSPLVFSHLNALCSDLIPPPILTTVRTFLARSRVESLSRVTELLKILQQLTDNSIPALPLKGALLGAVVYGNVFLREHYDVDVLVQSQHRATAAALLGELGYHLVPAEPGLEGQNFFTLMTQYSESFRNTDNGLYVDLHWSISPRFLSPPLDSPAFWSRCVQHTLFGKSVLDLSAEDLLIFLCIHGSKHAWTDLRMVVDVAETLRTYPDLDWAFILSSVRELRVTRMILLGLQLASAVLDAQLPDTIIAMLAADTQMLAVAAKLMQRFDAEQFGLVQNVQHVRNFLRIKEGRDKLLVYLTFVFKLRPNEKDRAAVTLPPHLSFLYYVLRPIRLVREYGSEFVSMLRGRS